jgi:xylan 1,4-beta-xylosidase
MIELGLVQKVGNVRKSSAEMEVKMDNCANNPILPGFYPDPSICRVKEDYYLVTSTFAYFPGVPIFHSRDLIHWEQIGNVLDRNGQINLLGAKHSGGIYAPTIRYHDGVFYMITTNCSHDGSFIVTASDPAGAWSDPYYLEGADGIDPSLFFDEDGRCYYVGTKSRREGSQYDGDNEIWVQELDTVSMRLIGESYAVWHGALRDARWPEGPHIYKKDKKYYLLIAEGGTDYEHAVSVAVGTDLKKSFTGCPCNPILTHRHLGHNYPIVNVGHGDLVETQNGKWYMVVLASRPYGGYYRNMGRETFLTEVEWEEGWPVVNPGIGVVTQTVNVGDLTPSPQKEYPKMEDFDDDQLPPRFLFLRNPDPDHYSLSERKGFLRLKLAPERITDLVSPSYVGVRQTGMHFILETRMEFKAGNEHEEAGIVLLQSNAFHYRFVITTRKDYVALQLIKCQNKEETVLAEKLIEDLGRDDNSFLLRVTADQQDLKFAYSSDGKSIHIFQSGVDARILSTDIAGGFTGTTMGLYASSNGEHSENYADFDWLNDRNLSGSAFVYA